MATEDDVRRIALSLPETDEHASYNGRPSFRVKKLTDLISDSWRVRAPKRMRAEFDNA